MKVSEARVRHQLIPFPSMSHPDVTIQVDLAPALTPVWMRFRIAGDLSSLSLPALGPALRGHSLWEHTCFEAFLQHDGSEGYYEANIAPSGAFAIYEFAGYRADMRTFLGELPEIESTSMRQADEFVFTTAVRLPRPVPSRLGISAVIEERCGRKSYWALAHPAFGPPDFHDPACFVLELPPASSQSSPRT